MCSDLCNIMIHYIISYYILLYYIILHYILLYYILLCYTFIYYIILYYILYCIIVYYTILYYMFGWIEDWLILVHWEWNYCDSYVCKCVFSKQRACHMFQISCYCMLNRERWQNTDFGRWSSFVEWVCLNIGYPKTRQLILILPYQH